MIFVIEVFALVVSFLFSYVAAFNSKTARQQLYCYLGAVLYAMILVATVALDIVWGM